MSIILLASTELLVASHWTLYTKCKRKLEAIETWQGYTEVKSGDTQFTVQHLDVLIGKLTKQSQTKSGRKSDTSRIPSKYTSSILLSATVQN